MNKFLILDTHTFVWFLQKNGKLPNLACELIFEENHVKVIPFITLCEIHYLHQHNRFRMPLTKVIKTIHETHDFQIANHNEKQASFLLPELDIHDALIVATAIEYEKEYSREVIILSKDELIQRHSPIPVLWK